MPKISQDDKSLGVDNLRPMDGPMFEVGGGGEAKGGFFARRVVKSKQPKDEALAESVEGIGDLIAKLEIWQKSLPDPDRKLCFGRAFAVGGLSVVRMGSSDPMYVIYDNGNFYLFVMDRVTDIEPNKEARQKYGYFRAIFLSPYSIQFNPNSFKQYAAKMIKILEKDTTYCNWLLKCGRSISGHAAEKHGYVTSFAAFPPAAVSLFGDYDAITEHVRYWHKSRKATSIITEEIKKAMELGQIVSYLGVDMRDAVAMGVWQEILDGNKNKYFFSGYVSARR